MRFTSATVLVAVALICTSYGYQVKPRDYNLTVQSLQKEYVNLEQEFRQEFQRWRQTGEKSAQMMSMLDKWQFPEQQRGTDLEDLPISREGEMCGLCRAVATQLIELRKSGASRQELFDVSYDLCISLKAEDPVVCRQSIGLNLDVFLYIVDTRPDLRVDSACAVAYQSSACLLDDSEYMDWTVNVDPAKKPITGSKAFNQRRSPNDIKIVQITDFHYDLKYAVDHNANCGLLACCRNDQGIPENPEDRAGRWGDYRQCDTPWDAVEDLIDHIAENHPDAQLVYHTGDVIDHGTWDTSVGSNLRSMDLLQRKLRETFPRTPVFNIFGNHDAHPTDLFAPKSVREPEFSMGWLYHYSASTWGHWLPLSSQATIKTDGYYSVLVRPGFRIIALNNQDCYTQNWWLLYQPNYPVHQLQWLHDELLRAERNGEKVHILAHVPYNSYTAMFRPCQREFRRIVERFYDTISGQFNGHTHRDEFYVYYSKEQPQYALSVAWNGGSATPWRFVNPNYVVYYADPVTYEVTDFESYSYNLTDANLYPERRPEWYKMYSLTEDFGISNGSPAEVDRALKNLAHPSSRGQLLRYWQYKIKFGEPLLAQGCDDECLLGHLCQIVVSETDDGTKCDELREIFYEE
ncbi:sphingomyelin phosphodiesterase-like [Uranotaenia lowii]|uniref:sphingomyelin phosphodiesterase-like n=1 Tax=Uranotaenia lowii TaxID=190385 RepID=UPI00247A10A7|nr:sphingomyelin phosphodiesterase-like [Uranotaenia lowii]